MKIKDLENAPNWLKNATVSDEDVEIIDGVVHWKSGIWDDGVWYDGKWENGTWKNGTWKNGSWFDGVWIRGTWMNGVWIRGTWHGGSWFDGTWENGNWYGGYWYDGTWKDGITCIKSKYNICYKNDIVYIGCKAKTFEEWDDWFKNSKKEFITPRDSENFDMIAANFYAIKAYHDYLKRK